MEIINSTFAFLQQMDDFLWTYIGVTLIVLIGLYFTLASKLFQIKTLIKFKQHIQDLRNSTDNVDKGVNPIKLYFASIGGMIGLGNIVVVMLTVTIGGPGSLVWLWIASLAGMLVKYSEIYLGIQHRVQNEQGGYDGGPMYYLKAAFGGNALPIIMCIFLCIYGVEVSQFLIITDTIVETFSFDRYLVIGALLLMTFATALGGVKRLANICSALMPPFMIAYIVMGIWVVVDHSAQLPAVLAMVWDSAWSGYAPVAGFAGSTILLAAQQGVERAVYSGDIGIGYDSIIQSETKATEPHKQARMAVYALFTDSLVCTLSILMVLLTGLWTAEGLQPSQYVTKVLMGYVPHVDIFMAVLFFLAGFTTVVGYLVVGVKCAKFISPRFGKNIYLLYAVFAYIFFSFFDQERVILIMSVSGGILMVINLLGVFKLRKQVKFM